MEKYAAVILAAGKGTRMNDGAVSPIPKVMFPVADKPIIYWSVKLTKDAGIEKIILVVGYKKEMIEEYFGDKIEYAVQAAQLGTGHAAAMARKKVEGKAENLIIFYGDNCLYKPESVKKLIESFEQKKPAIAMLSVISKNLTSWGFGRIVRNDEGGVTGIVEQKDCTQDQLEINEGNPGFYIVDANWFWQNIDKLSTNNAQHEYYLTDIVKMAEEQGKQVIALPALDEEEALGINTPQQQKQAEQILKERQN